MFDPYSNLGKAVTICKEINELKEVQRRLKATFAKRGLDGGAIAALQHPLWLDAEREIEKLEAEYEILI